MSKIRNVLTVFVFCFSLLFVQNFGSFSSHAVYTLEVASGAMLPDGFNVLPDGKGSFFITSYDNSNQQSAVSYLNCSDTPPTLKNINYYDTSSPQNINYKYSTANHYRDSANGFDNCICFSCVEPNRTILRKIFIEQGQCMEFLSLPLSNVNIDSPLKIAVCNDDLIFFVGNNPATSISAYNLSSGGIGDLTCENKAFHSVFTDVSKKYLYALTDSNNLVRYDINNIYSSYTFEAPVAPIVAPNLKFLTDTILVTSDGRILTLNKDQFKVDSDIKIDAKIKDNPDCVVAGFDDSSILAKTADKVISRIRCSDGVVTGKIELNENIFVLSKSGDKIIAVTSSGANNNKNIKLLNGSDIEEVTPALPSTPGGADKDNNENNPPPSGADEDAITSDVYTIDTENHRITDIEPGTTFAAFKNNLIFNGYSLVLRDASGAIKTGSSTKISTGHIVSFIRNGAEKASFKLIVKGDVTGTGTLTSRDISAFTNYLLGKSELGEDFLQAANINGNGDLDVIDLFLMTKLMQK